MPHDLSPSPALQDSSETDLVALVGSRLCHDLISPLGAISNGVELISMSGQADGPELRLISESVAAANARICFFRIAFGHAAAGQRIGASELSESLRAISTGGRIQIDWKIPGDQPRQRVKLALLAVMCTEQTLSRGGVIQISDCGDGTWAVRATGPQIRTDPALWQSLDGTAVQLTPAQVQFGLLPREAKHADRDLHWSLDETSAEIRF